MEAAQIVHIDFRKFRETFREFVRNKAIQSGSTIVYLSEGQLIEEDPKNNKTVILKDSFALR
jgi:hypothetical protein